MGCLDEHTIVAFVTGRLAGAALGAVERHLLVCPQCTALVGFAAPAVGTHANAARAPGPGTTVGRYRLLRLVGRGGVGEVWAAHDPKLERNVAIKIVRADTATDEVDSARLLREARAIAALSHPSVIAMYEAGTANGQVFLAMELIEGETLAVWRDRRPHTVEELLRVFVMAGQGLAAAHRAGIVHRDFKPQNVMVARDGGVRVMDFGLAAQAPRAGSDEPRLTRKGWILGTPQYMSPEQLRGQPADPRADQYSFCVALHEALYGERPFEGETFAALREVVLAGRMRTPPLLSHVPARLRAVILRGLAADRERRFPNMDALLAAIDHASRGRSRFPFRAAVFAAAAALTVGTSLTARRTLRAANRPPLCGSFRDRLASAWPVKDEGRRRDARLLFWAAQVADAGPRFERTAELLDGYRRDWISAAQRLCAPDVAEAGPRAVRASRARCLDQRLAEMDAFTAVLARGDARVVRNAIDVALRLPSVAACATVTPATEARAPDDPGLRGRIDEMRTRLRRLRVMADTGHAAEALKPISALADEARTAGYAPLLAETLLAFARATSSVDPDAAVALYEEAFAHGEAIHHDAIAAEAATELTRIVGAVQHHFASGERWTRVAEEKIDGGHHEPLRVRMLDSRGALHAARGRWRVAVVTFTAAIDAGETTAGANQAAMASALAGLAGAHLALDEPDQALAAADRAVDAAVRIYAGDSYAVAAARLARGRALLALSRRAEALPDLEAARASFEQPLGPADPRLADALTALGQLAVRDGRPADAQPLLARAWKLRASQLTDAGAREETAFALARAIWEAAPAERRRALALATEARDGYSTVPDLASRMTAVESWLEARRRGAAARWDPRPL